MRGGLTDDEKSKFNTELDDLMPWHKDNGLKYFSLLVFNWYVVHTVCIHIWGALVHDSIYNHRSTGGVRGFTRETSLQTLN